MTFFSNFYLYMPEFRHIPGTPVVNGSICKSFPLSNQTHTNSEIRDPDYGRNQTCLTLSLIRQFCSRRISSKHKEISIIEWITYDKKWKTFWQKRKLLVLFSVVFSLLSLCFQKAVCCRGVRKHLNEGKG